ncbi:MAG TPA: efflux transporter outer membrane subunit, partial [Burkholderiaceae bacterium]
DLPGSTVDADGEAQVFVRGTHPRQDWWRAFRSPEIEDLVDQAMKGNATLSAAEASLRQSQDSLRAGYGIFFPQAELGFTGARERTAPLTQGLTGPGSIFNVFTLSGSVAYAIDLFGGQRRTLEGLQARRDNARFEAEAARLTLQANVVETAIARAGYASQMDAMTTMLQLESLVLYQTEVQAKAGVLGFVNVVAARSQMAITAAQLALLKQKYDQSGHLLVNLQGDFAGRLALPILDIDAISLPRDLPVSLPSDLVRRRPDILAAEARLHAASADVGVASAALFPVIVLSGDIGRAGESLHNLSGAGGKFWGTGAAVDAPLFRGGSVWFGRKAAVEAYNNAADSYRQTVLDSFTQVADVLKALEHDAEAVKAQSIIVSSAEDVRDLVWANYHAGLVSAIEVLNAEIQVEQADINYTAAVAQRYQDTAALFAAIGGGWQNEGENARRQASRGAP